MASTEHDKRITELYRMNKRQLAAYYREHSGYVWSAVPPERWSKDQLVSDVLRLADPAPTGHAAGITSPSSPGD